MDFGDHKKSMKKNMADVTGAFNNQLLVQLGNTFDRIILFF